MRNSLRIIGGKWRGRRVPVPTLPGLRPTPDRVRETLFNWLAPSIAGAHCLDLFAGSGALGLEALSRGAQEVYFYDNEPLVIQHISNILEQFNKPHAQVFQKQIPTQLVKTNTQIFDIAFIDPPFQQDLVIPCCQWLEEHSWLKQGAYIYIECELKLQLLSLPTNWNMLRSKKAGQVAYYLLQKNQI